MKYVKISANGLKFHGTFVRLGEYLKLVMSAMMPDFKKNVQNNQKTFTDMISQFISNDFKFCNDCTDNCLVADGEIKIEFTNKVEVVGDRLAIYVNIEDDYIEPEYRLFMIGY